MKHSNARGASLLVAVAMVMAPLSVFGQSEQTFTGASSSDYNVDANWVGVAGSLVPDGSLGDEFAVIGSNTPDPLNLGNTFPIQTANLTSAAPTVGRLILGFDSGGTPTQGTLNIGAGGSIVVAVGTTSSNGQVVVGGGSPGNSLNLTGNGSITADLFNLSSYATADNYLNLSDTASFTSLGHVQLSSVTTITGPGVTFNAQSTLDISGTYVAAITNAAIHSKINVAGDASLSGALDVDLSGVATPATGDSWELLEAASVVGAFGSVSLSGSTALAPGQGLTTRNIDNGGTTSVEVSVEQFLTLEVNRSTGAVTLKNLGAAVAANDVSIDGYTINSAGNFLVPANGNWNSLDDQDVGGAGTWTESNPSAGRLSELQASGSTLFAGQSTQSLGNAYSGSDTFGVLADLEFTYAQSDGSVTTGFIEYTGNANTLVLQVDPATGEALVVNQSQFSVAIDGYTVTSEDDALLTTWNSLDDQNAGGGDWLEANPTSGRLSELKEADALTLNSGDSFSLGFLYDIGIGGDLVFEFLVNQDALAGDFDLDGDADGFDFLIWQQGFGGAFDASNLADWETDFGSTDGGPGGLSEAIVGEVQFATIVPLSASTAAVPEPTSAAMCLIAIGIGVATTRRKRRAEEPASRQ